MIKICSLAQKVNADFFFKFHISFRICDIREICSQNSFLHFPFQDQPIYRTSMFTEDQLLPLSAL